MKQFCLLPVNSFLISLTFLKNDQPVKYRFNYRHVQVLYWSSMVMYWFCSEEMHIFYHSVGWCNQFCDWFTRKLGKKISWENVICWTCATLILMFNLKFFWKVVNLKSFNVFNFDRKQIKWVTLFLWCSFPPKM